MITDLTTLNDFVQAHVGPLVQAFRLLGNGEDALDDIKHYYEADYAGMTAFLQIAEAPLSGGNHGDDRLTFFCTLTIADVPNETDRQRLRCRDNTLKTALHAIGNLRIAGEDSIVLVESEGDDYENMVSRERVKLMPIGRIANVRLEGWSFDLDVTIPANALLYPDL